MCECLSAGKWTTCREGGVIHPAWLLHRVTYFVSYSAMSHVFVLSHDIYAYAPIGLHTYMSSYECGVK